MVSPLKFSPVIKAYIEEDRAFVYRKKGMERSRMRFRNVDLGSSTIANIPNVPPDLIEPLRDHNGMSIGRSARHQRGLLRDFALHGWLEASPRSGPHRINSGTLSYLPRGGYPWHTLGLSFRAPSSSLLSLRLRPRHGVPCTAART